MTTQSTRFPSYGTGTTRDASSSSQPLNNFSSSNWNQPGSHSFWSNRISPTFSNTEPQTISRAGHDDSFANNTDSNNYPQMADAAAVWPHPGWNNVDSATSRRPSASPSPARVRESVPAFPTATSTASYLTSRTAPATNFSTSRTLDANTNAFRYPPAPLSTLRDSIGDANDGSNNAPAYSPFGFDAEAPSNVFPATSVAPSSGASISASTAASTAGHAHRASLQGPSSFSSPTTSGQLPFTRQSQSEDSISMALADLVRRQTLNVEESSDLNVNIYSATPSMPFQFNPGPQPWPMDPIAASLLTARGNLAPLDRGIASTGAAYRQMTNPRGLGMSANVNNQWGQPVSRDLRTAGFHGNGLNGLNSPADLLHRAQSLQLLQEQQLAAASVAVTAASFTGAANTFPGNVPPYYEYSAYRAPMQSPHLGLHAMNPSFVPPHVQIAAERDPTHALRSAFLDEFRANRMSRKYELKDIYGHMVEFSGDQHGSRFIQDKLETATSEEKEHTFLEISKNVLVLMRDVFGNYVVQKLFDYGSQVQKKYLAEQMKGNMVALSTQTYACRVIQKALSHILVEQQVELAQELEPDIISVVQDPNGNHVVQKIIELVPREHIGFIIEAFRGRVKELSSHNFGCRVIQRILEHGLEEDKALVLAELHANIVELVNDQFGNYVVQHVIQHGKQSDRERIISRVLDRMVSLSNNKFASNVVERCIQYGTAADRRRIREELNQTAVDGQPILQHMIKDQYGNYVIQKLLKQLKGEEFRLFFQSVSEQLHAVRPSASGRQSGAMERLALTLEQTAKANGVASSISQSKTNSTGNSSSISPASPQLPGDQDSTPSLTSVPTTPESSNPPSVKAGLPGRSLDTEEEETTATHQPKQAHVSVASL